MALEMRRIPTLAQRADAAYVIARLTPFVGDAAVLAERDAMHVERGEGDFCGCAYCVNLYGLLVEVETEPERWFAGDFDASQIDDPLFPYKGPAYPYHHIGDP